VVRARTSRVGTCGRTDEGGVARTHGAGGSSVILTRASRTREKRGDGGMPATTTARVCGWQSGGGVGSEGLGAAGAQGKKHKG